MKFRPHRGSLADSLSEQREILPTREALALEASLILGRFVRASEINVKPYGYDPRILWNTHIVMAGNSPIGFTDGPLT